MPKLTPPSHDDFLDHNDTPASYTGKAGEYVKVNAGEDALEFGAVASGATLNADTDVSGNAWVLDEDDMSSNDATKVPTQQSAKAYVDNNVGTPLTVNEQELVGRLTGGNVDGIAIGIADNNVLQVDGSPNAAEITVWTANGLDGKTYAELMLLLFGVDIPEQVAFTLDDALSADGKYCVTMALDGTCGAVLAYGDCVYFAVADSKWELAKGDAEATVSPMTGIVIVGGNEDAACKVAIMGEVRADAAFPALTVGAPVFIDPDTAGDVSTTELTTGEFQKAIGWALDANTVVLTGNPDWVKVA